MRDKNMLGLIIAVGVLIASAIAYAQTMNIKFAWNANPAADAVTGYKLHLGPGDGTYPTVVDAGNALSKVVSDDPAQRAAAVSAYNASGIGSELSSVLVFRPTKPGQPSAQPTAAAPAN